MARCKRSIGAANEKVKGFFDLCRAPAERGTGGIIPQANVKQLMLREDVVRAAAAGQFHVYAIESLAQAIELPTGSAATTPMRQRPGRLPTRCTGKALPARTR